MYYVKFLNFSNKFVLYSKEKKLFSKFHNYAAVHQNVMQCSHKTHFTITFRINFNFTFLYYIPRFCLCNTG